MKALVLLAWLITQTNFAVASTDMASNLGEGQATASQANAEAQGDIASEAHGFKNFNALKIKVDEGHKASELSTNQLYEEAKRARKDETYQVIASNQQNRNQHGFKEPDAKVDMKKLALGPEPREIQRYYTKQCQTPGDIYEISCTHNLQVAVTVLPEIKRIDTSCHKDHKKKNWCSTGSHPCDCRREVIDRQRQVIASDHWTSNCDEAAVDQLFDQGFCDLKQEVTGQPETREINDESVHREYWHTTRIYTCGFLNITQNSCFAMDLEGCTEAGLKQCNPSPYASPYAKATEDRSGDNSNQAGVCASYTHTYRCPKDKIQLPNLQLSPDGFCLDCSCLTTNRGSNHNLMQALSKLEMFRQMQEQVSNGKDISIFKGNPQTCTINFGGAFKDCCKAMKGVGIKFKVARQCTADEQALAAANAEGRTVYIGAYTKNKVAGVKTSKARAFCSFPSKIARIFQQEARRQLKIDWGSDLKNPNCRGLSIQELQSLDFNKMDLSELFEELQERAKHASEMMQTTMADKVREIRATPQKLMEQTYRGQLEADAEAAYRGDDDGANVRTY
jgi:hypothetical protein